MRSQHLSDWCLKRYLLNALRCRARDDVARLATCEGVELFRILQGYTGDEVRGVPIELQLHGAGSGGGVETFDEAVSSGGRREGLRRAFNNPAIVRTPFVAVQKPLQYGRRIRLALHSAAVALMSR